MGIERRFDPRYESDNRVRERSRRDVVHELCARYGRYVSAGVEAAPAAAAARLHPTEGPGEARGRRGRRRGAAGRQATPIARRGSSA